MVGDPFELRNVFTPMIGVFACMLQVFVIQAFFLNLAALIHGFHST